MEDHKAPTWTSLKKDAVNNFIPYDVDQSPGGSYALTGSQKYWLGSAFVDAATKFCRETGLKPDDDRSYDIIEEAANTAYDLIIPVNWDNSYYSDDTVWDNEQIRKWGKMNWDTSRELLIHRATKGEYFDVDIDSLAFGIGQFLDRTLRPDGVEKVLLQALIGREVSMFLESIYSKDYFTKKSVMDGQKKHAQHPITVFSFGRLREAGFYLIIMIGLGFLTSYEFIGVNTAFFSGLALLGLFAITTLTALASMPTYWSMWKSGELNKLPNLVSEMSQTYDLISTHGPLSLSKVRDSLERAEKKGAVWPASVYTIIEDLESRSKLRI